MEGKRASLIERGGGTSQKGPIIELPNVSGLELRGYGERKERSDLTSKAGRSGEG